MRIPRIYLKQSLEADTDTPLDSRSTHYLANVLRMNAGMQLVLFNGSGLEYQGTIIELGKKAGVIHLGDACDPQTESPLKTILGIGISRGERMDYVIQKSTELGVHQIQPLFTENCEVKLDDKRAAKRLEHWQQISISACEQCGRVVPPVIAEPTRLAAWLEAEAGLGYKFLLDQDQQERLGNLTAPDSVTLLVGPEGGFSDKEKTLAINKGFSGLNLGPRTLRTETAPVAALSLFQFLWEN